MSSKANSDASNNGHPATNHQSESKFIAVDLAERQTLRGMIGGDDSFQHIRHYKPDYWQNPEHRALFDELLNYQAKQPDKFTPDAIADYLTEQGKTGAFEAFSELVMLTPEPTPEQFKAAANTVLNYKLTPEFKAAHRPNRFKTLTLSQILDRPRPDWLVRGLLLENGYSAITGDYGTYKSFVALDIGLCIATGKDWQGREVKQGAVVYVVAEGAYTTADRVKAWCIRHQMDVPENFYVIEVPAQIGDAQVCAEFIEAVLAVNPVFIVLDTLTKCNVGADENSAKDMGLFTDGMQKVATETGAHVLAIHHNNKNGTARGSNSLPSNVDTHITFRASAGRVVTIECEKTKVVPFEAFALIGHIVELSEHDEYNDEVTSLVFEPTAKPTKAEAMTTNERHCLDLLPGSGALSDDWWQLARETGISKTTFYRCRDNLRDKNKVSFDNKTGIYRTSPTSPI